jgi:hypothetical protein
MSPFLPLWHFSHRQLASVYRKRIFLFLGTTTVVYKGKKKERKKAIIATWRRGHGQVLTITGMFSW